MKNPANQNSGLITELVKSRNYSIEKLIAIYRQYSNPEILNLIIKKTEKLVYKIAGEFKNKKIDQKDIQQVAFTGVLIAVNRFDVNLNHKFSTFAVYCIRGEILHYIRDSKLIRVPRWVWKINKLFMDFVRNFEFKNNRYPSIEEISSGINVSVEGIIEFLKVREVAFYDYKPIDKLKNHNGNGGYDDFDRNLIRSREYRSFDLVMEDRILLWDAIDKLARLNKRIVILNYFMGFSQKEIGKKVGISQRSVSRKLKESIRTLRGYFAEN